uniref:Uncharacterized protein n=1 Tax=Timema monikensis TaxID=170555 RepID=A0A7R9HQF2_9NEOP|nr:unnamed protein product [Timema monikensis]
MKPFREQCFMCVRGSTNENGLTPIPSSPTPQLISLAIFCPRNASRNVSTRMTTATRDHVTRRLDAVVRVMPLQLSDTWRQAQDWDGALDPRRRAFLPRHRRVHGARSSPDGSVTNSGRDGSPALRPLSLPSHYPLLQGMCRNPLCGNGFSRCRNLLCGNGFSLMTGASLAARQDKSSQK